ncbi:uncharacterized protein LY79DRAFT_579019 [Colletotrichum navitas]|uniref:CPAF-like PDZ domain-containing protein n=1 Tax=Colletotrichum navitas TaxID=681940 RepID=A0AAD8V6P7_9PEZI|nr:uncharacterized protein LY79DRAFT_579019 [Colletotrichum navitas]KAK1593796.1 hypothetical protein LY79DRAFT_579019 [Colletotrichum navitas]
MRSSSVVSPALLAAAAALIPSANAAEPCAQVSAAWAAQHASAPTVTPLVPAELAYACLNSVPIKKDAAIALVDSLVPYMEWQSDREELLQVWRLLTRPADAAYKADPPAGYDFPGFDMFAALSKIKENVQKNVYPGEYAFQSDLYQKVFAPGHDGHFIFYPDLLTAVFEWTRERALVSISEDGSSLPVIKIYEEVISTPKTASVVKLINGVDASKYLADTVNKAVWNRDANSAYNSMFFEMAGNATGVGKGSFNSNGRIRFIYPGANTTITFANGTEATFENHARVKRDLTGIVDGPSFYAKFCNPASPVSNTAPGATPTNDTQSSLPGYPSPIASTNDSVVSGYFLEGKGFEDVAVIALTAFEGESTSEFQRVTQQVIASSLAAGKTKLVIDFQQNGGGYVFHGYDFFRTLFPNTVQEGNSRWKENDGFLAAAEVVSDIVAGVNVSTSPDEDLVNFAETWFNWRYDYNITNQPFTSYEDKFAPQVFKNTNYTDLMRWNLNDPITTTNTTFGMGIGIHGYGKLVGLSQPFLPENIVILYDGVCASTCTVASEFLRHLAGVKSVAFGGLPVEGPIEGVGGTKGSQILDWSSIYDYTTSLLPYASTDKQKAAFARYTDLPLNRSISAAVNVRDEILRDNIADGTPAQYVREEADCRLYWTLPMITDVTAVWKAAANAAFNGGKCASGGIAKRDVSEKAEILRRDYLEAHRLQQRFEAVSRYTPAIKDRFWESKHVLKAIA